MIDIRLMKGLEYGSALYELKGELYGSLSCPYETERRVGSQSVAEQSRDPLKSALAACLV